MTVLDHMKAAGYDPNAARNADNLRRMGAGTMVPFTDGTQRPYPDGWPSRIKASAMAFFRIKEDE